MYLQNFTTCNAYLKLLNCKHSNSNYFLSPGSSAEFINSLSVQDRNKLHTVEQSVIGVRSHIFSKHYSPVCTNCSLHHCHTTFWSLLQIQRKIILSEFIPSKVQLLSAVNIHLKAILLFECNLGPHTVMLVVLCYVSNHNELSSVLMCSQDRFTF